MVPDIDGAMLAAGGLAKIKKANLKRLKVVTGKPRLGPCVGNVRNFIAIGLNYSDHAAEAGMPIPKEPIIFSKAPTSICGPNDTPSSRKNSTKLDYEVELGIVIGKRARYLDQDKAMSAVAGYFLSNDVSERASRSTAPADSGTRARAARPSGRSAVVRHHGRNQGPAEPRHVARRHGEKRQRGNTSTMIFEVEHLVWYCSQFFVMEPGDIIVTGTPPGVALGMKPTPKFLKAGDVVTLGITGLGEQTQKIVELKK